MIKLPSESAITAVNIAFSAYKNASTISETSQITIKEACAVTQEAVSIAYGAYIADGKSAHEIVVMAMNNDLETSFELAFWRALKHYAAVKDSSATNFSCGGKDYILEGKHKTHE